MTPSIGLRVGAALFIALTTGCGTMVAPLRYAPPPPTPEESFRRTVPESTPVTPQIDLRFRANALPNGVRVVQVERHDLPIVTAYLALDRGAADAGASDVALRILNRVLLEGTRQRTTADLAAAWARLGASASVSLGPDGCSLGTKVGASDLDEAVSLLAEMATQPRFTSDAFNDARAHWSRYVAAGEFVTSAILDRNALIQLFGREHPYGYVHRTRKDAAGMRVEDLAALHARLFQPAHATLIVVGDATPAAVDEIAARRLGSWSPSAPSPLPRAANAPPIVGDAQVLHYQRADWSETGVSIVARGPAATDRDLLALEILARMFGGMSSRLRGDVRERQGAAYWIGAGVSRYRLASLLTLSSALAGDLAMSALRTMLGAVRASRKAIDAADFERARTSILSDWRTRTATTDGLAAIVSSALATGLSLDDLASYPARLRAVTLQDAQRVAERYLAEEALRVVVAGDDNVRGDLETLGLGPVERVDAWGDVTR